MAALSLTVAAGSAPLGKRGRHPGAREPPVRPPSPSLHPPGPSLPLPRPPGALGTPLPARSRPAAWPPPCIMRPSAAPRPSGRLQGGGQPPGGPGEGRVGAASAPQLPAGPASAPQRASCRAAAPLCPHAGLPRQSGAAGLALSGLSVFYLPLKPKKRLRSLPCCREEDAFYARSVPFLHLAAFRVRFLPALRRSLSLASLLFPPVPFRLGASCAAAASGCGGTHAWGKAAPGSCFYRLEREDVTQHERCYH